LDKVRYKDKEKERREQEIIDAGSKLLAEHGYTNLNMDQLADVVGISKTTLYQHFRKKEELVSRIILQNMQNMAQQVEHIQAETPLKRLEAIIRLILSNQYQVAGLISMPDREALRTVIRNNPAVFEQRKQARTKIYELIDAAKASGEIDSSLPTPLVERVLISLQMAFVESREEADIQDADMEGSIEAVIRMFVHGVSAKS
jgi:AcrR family transcriptional regulator